MAFRADEAASNGYERAKNYLIPLSFSPEIRETSRNALRDIVDKIGPVVSRYPSWHPLVSRNYDPRSPQTSPNALNGYNGLDHTVTFAHGFITCPYHGAEKVISSANKIDHRCASIIAEEIDVQFYSEGAKPVLVKCEWAEPLGFDKLIPKKFAVPLMLEQEMKAWHGSKLAERWETMRPYMLGEPHGSRSSLFVDQDTALAMRKAYMAMVESGMFGPLRME